MNEEQKAFEEALKQVFGPSAHEEDVMERADLSEEEFALSDAEDLEILMHRDAHFGGSFEVMLEYYQRGGKGISEDLLPERIEELQQLQLSSGQDLASYLLGGAEAERVARARHAYRSLRELYDLESPSNPYPKLLADLILSEEEEAEEEVQAIVSQGQVAVPYLLQLLAAQDFYDPLYPGYGQAPALAAKCLGLIGDPKAITPLFEGIDSSDFFGEEAICEALHQIGQPAKNFLIRVLELRPMTRDNERAARALTHFVPDDEVAKACLHQLEDPEVAKHENLAGYLVLGCEGLADPEERQRFAALTNRVDLQNLRLDINALAKQWQKR